MSEPTCTMCPFWEHEQQQCRRNAPRVFQEEMLPGEYGERRFDYFPMFPPASPDDWCGEHPDRRNP